MGVTFLPFVLYSVGSTNLQTFTLVKQAKLQQKDFKTHPLELSGWFNYDFSWSGIGRFILDVIIEFLGAPIRLVIELFHLVTLNYFKKRPPVFDTTGGEKILARKQAFNVSAGVGTRVTGPFVRGSLASSNHRRTIL